MNITALLVPYNLGELRTGTGAGPEAIVAADALAGLPISRTATIISGNASNEIQACIRIDAALALEAHAATASGDILLVLSGNCHACLGTLAAIGPEVSVIWFDAHGDLNTPDTTESGFFDGMALASAVGWTWSGLTSTVKGFRPIAEENILLVGGRDLDGGERDRLSRSQVRHYAPPALTADDYSITNFAAILAVRPQPRAVYVHIDLDILDPTVLVANKYAVSGGVSLAWLECALRTIRQHKDIVAVGVTSYDPACHAVSDVAVVVRRLLAAALA